MLYEILVEDALLRQVIADRQAQFTVLSAQDKRRGPLANEITMLHFAQTDLMRLCQQAIRYKQERHDEQPNA